LQTTFTMEKLHVGHSGLHNNLVGTWLRQRKTDENNKL